MKSQHVKLQTYISSHHTQCSNFLWTIEIRSNCNLHYTLTSHKLHYLFLKTLELKLLAKMLNFMGKIEKQQGSCLLFWTAQRISALWPQLFLIPAARIRTCRRTRRPRHSFISALSSNSIIMHNIGTQQQPRNTVPGPLALLTNSPSGPWRSNSLVHIHRPFPHSKTPLSRSLSAPPPFLQPLAALSLSPAHSLIQGFLFFPFDRFHVISPINLRSPRVSLSSDGFPLRSSGIFPPVGEGCNLSSRIRVLELLQRSRVPLVEGLEERAQECWVLHSTLWIDGEETESWFIVAGVVLRWEE